MNNSKHHHLITVNRLIPAVASAIFDILAAPSRHHEFDGSNRLQAGGLGPARMKLGDVFEVNMQLGPLRYQGVNTVVEFEADRAIAWRTDMRMAGRVARGGQVWRFTLAPGGQDLTRVTHTFDYSEHRSPAMLNFMGVPAKNEAGMRASLENLEAAVTA